MSMLTYPEYGFGLVFCGDEIADFLEKTGYDDPWDFAEAMNEHDDAFVRYYDDEMYPSSFISAINRDVEIENEPMLVFWAEKQPEPFKAVYTLDSVKIEFLTYLKDYLPKDFDWESHLGYFSCVVCC